MPTKNGKRLKRKARHRLTLGLLSIGVPLVSGPDESEIIVDTEEQQIIVEDIPTGSLEKNDNKKFKNMLLVILVIIICVILVWFGVNVI